MKITKKFSIFAITLLAIPLALLTGEASATINDNITFVGDEFAIAVSPPIIEFDITPGTTTTEKIRVRNVGTEEADLRIGVAPLTVVDETYLKNTVDGTPRTEITRWTTIALEPGCSAYKTDDNGDLYVHLRVKEECYVKFSVKTPSNAPYGSQHMNIFFEEFKSDGGEDNVQVIRSIGVNLYGTNTVGQNDSNGPCGKLKSQDIPFWRFNGPLTTSALIENCGVLDFHASIEMEITNIFGATVYKDEQPDNRIIMAETERRIEGSWKDATIGIYKTKQVVKFLGETKEVIKWTLIIPAWLLIVILACILIVAFSIARSRRNRKSNRRGR